MTIEHQDIINFLVTYGQDCESRVDTYDLAQLIYENLKTDTPTEEELFEALWEVDAQYRANLQR